MREEMRRKFVITPDYPELPEYLNVKKYFDIPLRRISYYQLLTDEIA